MYKVGDIFTLDDEYSARAEFCNQNNFIIAEITKEGDSERRFQIQEVPELSEKELLPVKIAELKAELNKYKEDVEQVDLFGMQRSDYAEKKAKCASLVLQIRELEKQQRDDQVEAV